MDPDSLNHKTIFLVNHTKDFLKLSGEIINIDVLSKKGDAAPTALIPPITKSYWTSAVESILEYCRIVFDIFSTEKWFSLISIDSEEKILSAWFSEDQTLEVLWDLFINEGAPVESNHSLNSRVFPGLKSAVSMLQLLTPEQQIGKVKGNSGRIIFVSCNIRDNLNEWLAQAKDSLNDPGSTENNSVAVDHCEIVFIDVFPTDSGCNQDTPVLLLNDSSPHRFYYLGVCAGRQLCRAMVRLCESHFLLASTTVQDIPMKEEQNTTNSAMYGVEMLHRREAHEALRTSGVLEKLYLPKPPISGFTFSVGIKWVTPKSTDIDLRYCTGAYRTTTADVCGRASICLTQFVLSGRSITLEHKLPSTLTSDLHFCTNEALMLSSHGGVIHLHRLSFTRDPLEGRPGICEGCGGKVTDYRITEMADMVKGARLFPASDKCAYLHLPRIRAQQHLERFTRYWPLTISDTLIYSKSMCLGPLLETFPKEVLDAEDIQRCQESIITLIKMEERNEPLPVSIKGKQTRRDEVYRVVMTELEYFINQYSDLSPQHAELSKWLIQTSGRADPLQVMPQETNKPTGLPALDLLLSRSPATFTPPPLPTFPSIVRDTERLKLKDPLIHKRSDLSLDADLTAKRIKSENSVLSNENYPVTLKDMFLGMLGSKQISNDGVLEKKNTITELYKSLKDETTPS